MPHLTKPEKTEEELAMEMIASWPRKERLEITAWLNGALTGRGVLLSGPAAALLYAFRVRFPDFA